MDAGPSHRRSIQGTFLPPPPPVSLPPVSTSFQGSSYHGSSPSTVGMPSASQSAGPHSAASTMHMNPAMPYSGHMSMSQQVGAYSHYPIQQSPATMSALPASRSGGPHGYSPRIAGGYPTASPTMNPLSPVSPSTHVGGYPGPSSTSTSASSFPPSVPPPHSRVDLPSTADHRKRRTASDSGGSWEDRKDDDQPWGMPQEQYKALNPRDKKQVRNRIGARRFRAKRKGECYCIVWVLSDRGLTLLDYVNQLETSKKEAEARIMHLESLVESTWRENNDLRARLNMPPAPPPDTSSTLGLVVGSGE